ncbi:MAG: 50S ribosomal protein L11 methyltransferase [Deltaproteobacteria bacterium]|nr:50S ribosomal protein L11 methyltransferase [Deltaproteobacteria bacterium]
MREWLELSVSVPNANAECVESFLLDYGAPGLITEDGERATVIRSYWTECAPLAELERFCTDLGFWQVTRYSTVQVADENWADNWRMHFQPTAVGDQLWVCPPWASSPKDRISIVINPGMAFGTGQHATTRGCLSLIERRVLEKGQMSRALDVGTGSGILAIALAKLGTTHVSAADIDPCARHAATDNCIANAVVDTVHIIEEWLPVGNSYDLIVANLFAGLLVEMSEDLSLSLTNRGALVCSGFLAGDEEMVQQSLERHGLKVCARIIDDGWVTLLAERIQ